jgi:hypothetical protein
MTQDEIIELARRAGFNHGLDDPIIYAAHERFAKLVAEKEREACATMSDWILKEGGGTWGDAIRARGQA